MKIENLKGIIDLDGSYGSGGGQILRTALALSLLTQRPFKLRNIRVKRKDPGLRPQHLACINIAKQLSNAYVQNAEISSREILFVPKNFEVREIKVDIGTAGSISLVLQTIMPALLEANLFKAEIIGGTDVAHAPPIDYIKYVLLHLLNKIGYEANIEIIKRGFYPKGGGKIIFNFSASKLKPHNFVEKGKFIAIKGNAIATETLKQGGVAEKLYNFAMQWLKTNDIFKDLPIEINKKYVNAYSDGAILCLWLETEKSVLGASSLGEKGKPSEVVAREAAIALVNEISGVIDSHAADQLLPFLAYLAFKYKTKIELKTSKITDHARTNAWVIEKFLPVKFEIDEKKAWIGVFRKNYKKSKDLKN